MKIINLKVGDRFLWKGDKYQVFLKTKDFQNPYLIPCIEWPLCGDVVDMPSGREVKKIIRL